MWFDGQRQPNTIYVANTSRGKDSTAMLRAIQLMGWPLDMICSVDIWFDDDTPAELPPMVVFKDDYDRKVFERFGISVTRLCAMQRLNSNGRNIERERERERRTPACSTLCVKADIELEQSLDGPCKSIHGATNSKPKKLTYTELFYRPIKSRFCKGQIRGFPIRKGNWCTSDLKRGALDRPWMCPRTRGRE